MKGMKNMSEAEKNGTFADVWKNRQEDGTEREDFRKKIEMEIIESRPGYAKGQIEIRPWHLNVLGIVHGGVLFTLADTVGGTAAATGQVYAVPTVEGSIHYLKAGRKTSRITAVAEEIKNGNAFSVCECRIYDDRENLLATASMTYYHLMPRE